MKKFMKVVETVPGVGFVYHEPEALEGQFSRLYLNEGNLRFRDVSESWGLTCGAFHWNPGW